MTTDSSADGSGAVSRGADVVEQVSDPRILGVARLGFTVFAAVHILIGVSALRHATPAAGREPKSCRSCGRRIQWRKKWERSWDSVLYCSDACRARKVRPIDAALEEWLLTHLQRTARGRAVDPADAASALAPDGGNLGEPARSAARRLVNRGLAEMVQRGVVVDPSTAKGPVALRLPRS